MLVKFLLLLWNGSIAGENQSKFSNIIGYFSLKPRTAGRWQKSFLGLVLRRIFVLY